MFTHEQYIQRVAAIVTKRCSTEDAALIKQIKLAFGAGSSGLRGVTYYGKWKGNGAAVAAPFVEICAFGKEHDIQLAGTTIHELGHVVAGHAAGHGPDWHKACARLGLVKVLAAGTEYTWENFEPKLARLIQRLPKPDDGSPVSLLPGLGPTAYTGRACPAGIGTRGGKSRGIGSGSRLRLFECECTPPTKARVARDIFNATCNCCSSLFHGVLK